MSVRHTPLELPHGTFRFHRPFTILARDFMVLFAERLSSAMNALGAECAARSTIRDKRVHSL
jgi:hypothetical protein